MIKIDTMIINIKSTMFKARVFKCLELEISMDKVAETAMYNIYIQMKCKYLRLETAIKNVT